MLRFTANREFIFSSYTAEAVSSLCKETSTISDIHNVRRIKKPTYLQISARISISALVYGSSRHRREAAQCKSIFGISKHSRLFHFDDFIASAVAFLQENHTHSVRSYQTRYWKDIRVCFPKTFYQNDGQVRMFVRKWCFAELELSFLSQSKSST